ncbi:hypothetical protein [Natronorubrum sulfidifaciens]|uniref:hypothetical protein n=1 Tax=Natronorubrum sulfidifaciens TaxID=388259 RepID=UPI0012672545|nr:hypothetical protein [Natronorubrum sulfidifaciens]
MNTELAKTATEGKEEMAFWTVASLGYLYTVSPEIWKLIATCVLIPLASVSYYELENLREKIRGLQSEIKTRNRNTREDVNPWEILLDLIWPQNRMRFFGYTVTVLNGIAGAAIYYHLLDYLRSSSEPELIAMILFALPLIYFWTLFWTVIRHKG